ncbi:MAG: SCP2 sterol-binding domain-containing protein [Microthrixaceae bacterium]
MVQYLSDEWLDEAGSALAATTVGTGEEPVVLQYEVTAAPGGKRTYSLTFDDGHVVLAKGSRKDATTSFSLDYDVAVAVARGELSAQTAFMQGRLKLGGDVMMLVRQHHLLDGVTDALADLRDRTEY